MKPLHAAPAAGFDEPFELMAACHERMARTLGLLGRIGEHVATHGCDAQARDAAKDVLRYFTIAAPLHHQDEELHVIPRLRARGRDDLADRLLKDHREMEAAWAAIRPGLEAIRDGVLDPTSLPAERARWAAFTALHADHIDAEDHDAYPMAGESLAEPELSAMGREMAGRRRV
ncbi:hemerythrin domain-containing protein [Mitsuaria sp. GD03876]|uniref:hemerythrin domain-containing protein n=1 Tax=Mitsuaria sp. GD03876 TaxID=2975399 RepID=UPI00244771A7|nr:hemerythrin domain-containing protein [Mitsuaria sp. GD03876]MDH0864010.1 hemerythrin domain-containing protein [Mitsuaria sp. GD03876]